MKAEKNYISQQGYEKLLSELNHLSTIERPQVVATVSWAASLGDRSENADYQYGKRRLRQIDARLRFLNSRINSAEIVDYSKNQGSGKIYFGATVRLEDEEGDGEETQYIIVGQDEIDLARGMISYKSPIGKTLIGKEIGDEVEIISPTGRRKITIISVQYDRWDC